YGARYFRFFFGDAASGECMDSPDSRGRCLLRQPIRALSAPYLLTRSDFMRPVGLDIRRFRFKLIDRHTGDTLGSMTWYQQGSTGLMSIFNSFVGFPFSCPVGNGNQSLAPLLEKFPPAPHTDGSPSPNPPRLRNRFTGR